ncbi:hypothetical protein GB937_010199 [Aspergillus fischeri]|nr:hypothetical protein GB937_010199 [Aspergillus fischeri]
MPHGFTATEQPFKTDCGQISQWILWPNKQSRRSSSQLLITKHIRSLPSASLANVSMQIFPEICSIIHGITFQESWTPLTSGVYYAATGILPLRRVGIGVIWWYAELGCIEKLSMDEVLLNKLLDELLQRQTDTLNPSRCLDVKADTTQEHLHNEEDNVVIVVVIIILINI